MNKRKILPFILPIAIIIVWYIITDGLHLVKPFILPSPVGVLNSAINILQSGKLFKNTVDTLFKVFSGLILASVVAIPLGIIMGWYQTLEDLASFIISVLRPIPPVAWIPFSILWFGYGTVPAIFIIFMGCVFPILVYTLDGVKRTDKVLIESAQTLGATDGHILKRVILPSTVPYMILTASNLFDTGTTVVGMLVIGLIGLAFDYVFGRIQKRIFW